jgi:hypothetical protein
MLVLYSALLPSSFYFLRSTIKYTRITSSLSMAFSHHYHTPSLLLPFNLPSLRHLPKKQRRNQHPQPHKPRNHKKLPHHPRRLLTFIIPFTHWPSRPPPPLMRRMRPQMALAIKMPDIIPFLKRTVSISHPPSRTLRSRTRMVIPRLVATRPSALLLLRGFPLASLLAVAAGSEETGRRAAELRAAAT